MKAMAIDTMGELDTFIGMGVGGRRQEEVGGAEGEAYMGEEEGEGEGEGCMQGNLTIAVKQETAETAV